MCTNESRWISGALQGNCQQPVPHVGSRKLSPNRARGVAALRSLFYPKTGQPPSYGVGKDCNFVYLSCTVRIRKTTYDVFGLFVYFTLIYLKITPKSPQNTWNDIVRRKKNENIICFFPETLVFTSTHDCLLPLAHERWKFSEIEE